MKPAAFRRDDPDHRVAAAYASVCGETTMTVVTGSELRQVLSQWQNGTLTAPVVHDWAELRFSTSSFEPEDDAVNEVLAILDMLDVNLVTVEDVPALQDLLDHGSQSLEAALAAYETYISRVDFDARRTALSSDPLYAPYCAR